MIVEAGKEDVLLPTPPPRYDQDLADSFEEMYSNIFKTNTDLTRGLVSFQDSKKIPIERWYKYREGFSSTIVKYYLAKYKISDGKLLDPFLGGGTSVMAASSLGMVAHGIELLPIGHAVINAKIQARTTNPTNIVHNLEESISKKPWKIANKTKLNELKITKMAYSQDNHEKIERYLSFLKEKPQDMFQIYNIALLSILEDISFTRKDGQYLRWDARSGKTSGGFLKGVIVDFDSAIENKLKDILEDLNGKHPQLFEEDQIDYGSLEESKIFEGSCLHVMPKLEDEQYNAIFTSPPYANRYDYTRTYALELALLGKNEEEVKQLRQSMLSCTVENRDKDLMSINDSWASVIKFSESHPLFMSILSQLTSLDLDGKLNNSGIVRMLRNYIIEMSCVIYESYRIIRKGGYMFMVNDNVRYAGLTIPIDILLSEIASYVGFEIISIDVLPTKKGNSSQQMGVYGQDRLRKCVYVWRKNANG
ncbi:hypothetical protein [Deinococcus sp.]|uniref:hypothetical protein n=1 Tax=Deinococcus sp. TaxID=47478 RepID=UPI003C7EC71E